MTLAAWRIDFKPGVIVANEIGIAAEGANISHQAFVAKKHWQSKLFGGGIERMKDFVFAFY